MALTDDLAEIKPQYRTFADWLASGPEDAATALDAIRDITLPIEPVLRALRRNGIPCTRATIEEYRNVSQ